jgi:uncharacterized protein (DUF983 family)
MNAPPRQSTGQPGFVPAALFGLCPRCGARELFAGVARFAPKCPACGLDFSTFNVGDGPAAFLTLIIGAMVTVLAGWMALSWDPPAWVYVAVLVPMTVLPTIWGLRVSKAALLAAEYRRAAGEGRREE